MYQDQANMNSTNWQIADGMTVYAMDGTKLGTVRNYVPQDGYLDVRKGWLFPRDFYVPFDAVQSVTEDGIMLGLTQDALQDEQYSNPTPLGDSLPGGFSGAIPDPSAAMPATGTQLAEGEDIRVPVREEELVVGKRSEEQGRVRIHKDVIEEQRTVNVPLRQEQVTVERVPFSGDAAAASDTFTEKDIEVPVMGEKAVVGKQVRGVEEVRIRKNVVTDQEEVSDTIRKEQVNVDGANEIDQLTARDRATNR